MQWSWIVRRAIITHIAIVVPHIEAVACIVVDHATNTKRINIAEATISALWIAIVLLVVLFAQIVIESVFGRRHTIVVWELRCIAIAEAVQCVITAKLRWIVFIDGLWSLEEGSAIEERLTSSDWWSRCRRRYRRVDRCRCGGRYWRVDRCRCGRRYR